MSTTSTTCAICLEELAGAEQYAFDRCGHAFHARCTVEWLRRGNLSCPTCRADVAHLLDARTLLARARFLRATVARRKTCPADLHLLVGAVRRAEEAERRAARAYAAHEREHGAALKRARRLRAARWRAASRVRDAVRALGAYASPSHPLPALAVVGPP